MKTIASLAFILFFACSISFAQTGKTQKLPPNPYEARLKLIVGQLLDIINGKAPVTALTGTKPPRSAYGTLYYDEPALIFAGAMKPELSQYGVKWDGTAGKTSWDWSTVLVKTPKGTAAEKLQNELRLLQEATTKLYPAAIKTTQVEASNEWVNFATADFDVNFFAYYRPPGLDPYLSIRLYFKLPLGQTKAQLADSLQRILDKELAANISSKEKFVPVKEWMKRLSSMGFDKEMVLQQGKKLVQKAAAVDIRLAYDVLMDWYPTEDLKPMNESLTYSQQGSIKRMMDGALVDYVNSNTKKPEPVEKKTPTPTPPVKEKEPEETDVCKKEVAALAFRPGQWIYGQNRSAIVFNYNCGVHLYTIAWMNSKGRLEFESDVTKESLAAKYRLAEGYQANKFIICRDCTGRGYGYGYDRASSYIGSLRIEYNTGELVRQSCMYCGGKGCMKVN